MRRVVTVFGGNAFAGAGGQLTMRGQFEFAQGALKELTPLFSEDCQLLISHGNGPQVGHMLTRVEEALGKAYSIPLEVCVAESEGELGYVLQQSLYNMLLSEGISRPIVSLLTQVVVDEDDPAFLNPTKPIGPFFDQQRGQQMQDSGFAVVEDSGRGFRRVVPSPEPRRIVEIEVMEKLLEMGVIVVAAGGGGIPVVQRNGQLSGVEAVIDKDLTAAMIAEQLNAELLLILTGVPCAYRNFNADNQEAIGRIDTAQAKRLIEEGHFAPGSMLPKMEAALRFVTGGQRRAIICDPPSVQAALRGEAGTILDTT